MSNATIYYQDETGKVSKSDIAVVDGSVMVYPSSQFELVEGKNLVPKAGITVLDTAKGEAEFAAQLDRIHGESSKRAVAQQAEAQDRKALLKQAFEAGEFGKMTAETVRLISGVDVS